MSDDATETRPRLPAPRQAASIPAGEAGSPLAERDDAAVTGPAKGAWASWRPSVVTGLWTWLACLALSVMVAAIARMPVGYMTPRAGRPKSLPDLLGLWHRWDTTWYVRIAENGYAADERGVAFFPLYPMLVRIADPLLPGGALVSAMAVSSAACLAALILVHRLVGEMAGADDARRVSFYLIAFPTGFFLVAGYNEGLFIALAVGSLYCMRKGLWWWAGILAGFASATRLAGVVLGAAFLYEYLRQRQFSLKAIRADLIGIALVPAGLLCYMAYCYSTFGRPLFFLEQQSVWNRSGFTPPWETVAMVVRQIAKSSLTAPYTILNIANLGAALGVLVLLVLALVGPWKLGRDHVYLVVFSAAIILMPLCSPIHAAYPINSTWRYALECTVAFMVLARMGRNPNFDRIYLTLALAMQGVMLVAFLQYQFIA